MGVTALGPIIAGLLVGSIGWAWVYLPGMLAALLALSRLRGIKLPARLVPADAPGLDVVGAVLLFLAVATLIDGFMQAGVDGLTAPNVLAALGFGLLLGVGWIAWELRHPAPLLNPRVARNRAVALALVLVFMRFLPATLGGPFLARYVQEVLGFSPSITGFAMLPATVAMVLVAGAAGKLLDRIGVRRPTFIAMAALTGSAALYAIGLRAAELPAPCASAWRSAVWVLRSPTPRSRTPSARCAADERGAIAGLMPLAGQFGTALWLAVLTAALVALGGTADPVQAQLTALPQMGWATVVMMLVTWVVAMALAPKLGAVDPSAPKGLV